MIYCIGESLLDIIITTPDNVVVRPGGAMLNAAVSIGRSGFKVKLISELGDDDTANLITNFLKSNGIDSSEITKYTENNTCLALAFLDKQKKPSYTFVKNYPKKRYLNTDYVFKKEDIILFGSIYSIDENIRESILQILNLAKTAGSTIIYDPNIRHSHHVDKQNNYNSVVKNIELASIIKGSDEDFNNIFNTDNVITQIGKIRAINSDATIIITQGEKGVTANYNSINFKLNAEPTNVVSTIGAGDAFNAGIIIGLLNHNNETYNNSQFEKILRNGLKYSAKVCSSFDNYISIN